MNVNKYLSNINKKLFSLDMRNMIRQNNEVNNEKITDEKGYRFINCQLMKRYPL